MIKDYFSLKDKVIVVTGGAGLLGIQHVEAIAEYGGIPVLLDINEDVGISISNKISKDYDINCMFFSCDITDEKSLNYTIITVVEQLGPIYGLINNAANNEKMEEGSEIPNHRLENFPVSVWEKDLNISLTGAFLCSRIIGPHMVNNGGGVILNISSDLGIIAPDQRIYHDSNIPDDKQIVKPVTYSVVKHALIGLTKYLSTYWLGNNIRVNTLCPGGVYSGQSHDIVEEINSRIPLGRMAKKDDYKAAIVFLLADSSSYMNGATLVIDGGRSVW